jgi:hypothetical protein
VKPTLVLVDFSNIVQTCWHPAIAAHEAGEKALAEHAATCKVCLPHDCTRCEATDGPGTGNPLPCALHPDQPIRWAHICPSAPKRYDLHEVYRENLRLKVGTLTEALQTPVHTWLMVKDSRSTKRYEAFPEYKGNRERKDTYGDPRPEGEEYFRNLGCDFYIADGYEADDAIAALALGCRETANVVIVSSDKDLWQLLSPPDIRVFSPTLKLFIGPERLEKAFQVSEPRHIRLCKALWGDASDNMPNAVPRMQKALLPLIKASDGSLDDFLRKVTVADLSPRCRELLTKGIDQVATNYFLAGLMAGCAVKRV